jgi:hypothetical protein
LKKDGVRASIDIEIKTVNREEQTIFHETIKQYKCLSISASLSIGSAGQCYGSLLVYFGEINGVSELVEIWRRWHLNDMNPGCVHQKTGSCDDKEIMSQVCSETGYKYGSSWLVEPLPDDVEDQIVKIVKKLDTGYIKTDIEEFIEKNGINFEATRVNEFEHAFIYYCVFTLGGKKFVVPEYSKGKGIDSKESRGVISQKTPKAAEVLECIKRDLDCEYNSYEEFCYNLGYEEDSRESEDIYKYLKKQSKDLKGFLGTAIDEFECIVCD